MWTKEWPKEKGSYWFYGWLSKSSSLLGDKKPALHLVKVRHTASESLMYSTPGQFLFRDEGVRGLWQKAVLPELPKLTNYEEVNNDKQTKA